MTSSNLIALDCDGVLLDYGSAYGRAWTQAFGQVLSLKNSDAYWPMDRWGVPRLSGSELERFRAAFDQSFWSSIPAISGAVDACQKLIDAGFVLICVTALDKRNLDPRKRNLSNLGFPLSDVIATPHKADGRSPKADVLNELRPAAFVDDFAPYLRGVDGAIHKALIVRDPINSPNTGEVMELAHSTHANLTSFASWWCDRYNSGQATHSVAQRTASPGSVVSEIIILAEQVLGSKNLAERWLTSPALALQGEVPINHIHTDSGRAAVEELLLRIEAGVYI